MDKESGQRLSKVLNGFTLTRCSKPYKIVMWFKQVITANIRQYFVKVAKICRLIPLVFLLGCAVQKEVLPDNVIDYEGHQYNPDELHPIAYDGGFLINTYCYTHGEYEVTIFKGTR